jgi:hypothetical protein
MGPSILAMGVGLDVSAAATTAENAATRTIGPIIVVIRTPLVGNSACVSRKLPFARCARIPVIADKCRAGSDESRRRGQVKKHLKEDK